MHSYLNFRDQTTDQQLVSVDINLDLYEKLDPYSVKREVANIIYNNAPEERYNDNIGYRVSDLILYESLRTYFDIPYGKQLHIYVKFRNAWKLYQNVAVLPHSNLYTKGGSSSCLCHQCGPWSACTSVTSVHVSVYSH